MSGPNDTLDMSDYPPATREELELSANVYAERAYKVQNENKRLREALHPFTIRGAGLYFDTRPRDGVEVVKCRQCDSWSIDGVEDFRHAMDCIYAKAIAALMAEES